MDPNAGYSGFPVPTQSLSNQMSFYPSPIPQQFPPKVPTQGQSFGTMQGIPGGAMIPSSFPQQSAPMDAFSASFAQPPVPGNMNQFSQPNTSTNTPSTVAQTFNQNMANLSANNMLTNQLKPQISSPQGTQPETPGQAHAQIQSPAQAQAQAMMISRDKARISTLLDINSALLQEVVNLQHSGKAGPPSNNEANGTTEQSSSPEYYECMRRLQANLAYLATTTDRAKKGPSLQAPAIMTPPRNIASVIDLYQKLNELFPNSGRGSTPQRPSPSPLSESVV
ncbi:hypothetical protein N7495_009193 [Penicillium taxi]|uniref:uncharacterized protein n=1 Tax=Penicillium taxi TaxID=168475 RepID=UPI002545976B|nr:uncharacterized protein N7495_009193 [Penicillium taxi]KAJ5884683.1 hypothetical protein N7495_009193 [Penicillium taxi]